MKSHTLIKSRFSYLY